MGMGSLAFAVAPPFAVKTENARRTTTTPDGT